MISSKNVCPKARCEKVETDFRASRALDLAARGEPAADSRIDGPQEHDAPGVINLFGVESPGLTASLAIGELVRDRVRGCCEALTRFVE
ncbi:hypothetical protein DSM21852_28260 [Methylocystis bryophila]|nr:hypothetical protein DSM21852_28260 [Methylocystis bryophila]